MKIRNITIENFQSYYGVNTLEFGDGLNLIIGNGGKGKSKLFNAFYWVLFGKIYITDYGWCSTEALPINTRNIKMKKHEYINKKALHDTDTGSVRCSVRVELITDDNNLYEIERSVSAVRVEGVEWDSAFAWNISPNTVKVSFDSHTGTRVLVDDMAEDQISNLFPAGIRGYIWFQGESLDDLINFSNPENLKDAVKHISYFPFYEKLTDIISQAKAKIESQESRHLREANQKNSDARNILRRMEQVQGKLQAEFEHKTQLENTISKIQVALAEDEGKVSGLAKFSEIVTKYDKCDLEIKDINNELDNIDSEERRLLSSLWVLRGTGKLIQESKRIINSHVEDVYTAPEKKYLDNPSRAKLEEILNVDHKCYVCGCPVDEAHPERVQWIKDRLKMQEEFLREMEEYSQNIEASARFNMFIGKIQDYPDSLLVSISNIDQQYMHLEERVSKLLAKRRILMDKKKELDNQLEEIKRKHGVDPHREAERFTTFDNTIRVSRGNLERHQKELRACEDAINDFNLQLKDLQQELSAKGSQTGVVTVVEETEWKHISSALETICKRVQEKARKELLKKIEERANEFYTRFTEHDRGYKGRVEIDDNYSIMFDPNLNTSHDDRKKMSIINALLSLNQEALNMFYPFISDAPTSNFDPDTTHKYLMGIKDIFGQTIVMTKDVVIGSNNYDELYSESKVSRIYQLNSELYCDASSEPEIYEVCTKVERLK